jgi:hypothetical protein
MSKEKTPFEKTAAALKVMGKKIAAKKNEPRRELQCVWIANNSGHAVATDGHVLACLDLNYWENLSRPEMLNELAFYADMQVLSYINGDALISAEKKEAFVKVFGVGDADPITYDFEKSRIPYPDWKVTVPPAESLQHVSKTGALFYPGQLGVLDLVADAFEVMLTDASTIAYNLYGSDDMSGHIAIYPGLLLMAMPLNFSKERISVVPSKDDVEAFFKPSKFDQIEMNFDEKGESENEKHADD